MTRTEYILGRIESKKDDYRDYAFTHVENAVFKTFFDLAQEFDQTEDLYILCVAVVKVFFGLDARLYVVQQHTGALARVATTEELPEGTGTSPPEDVLPGNKPYNTPGGSMVLTIKGKKSLINQLPFKTHGDVLGLLEVYPVEGHDEHRELFFQKYANRIGFNVHNRFLVEKNIEHLRFIRTLVADIEHNIIVPNMFYKLFLRDLRTKIARNKEIEQSLAERLDANEPPSFGEMSELLDDLRDTNQGLDEHLGNIEQHYQSMTLFLETLLRRSHFERGKLTLRTKPCNMESDVVAPQLERYRDKLNAMGVTIDQAQSGIPQSETVSVVDLGLMAQVYANLFSNAVKYAEPVNGQKRLSYGFELLADYFGQGDDGIKYNVYSTGPHLAPQERDRLFEEGYRGKNTGKKPGTGHGLSFVKNVVQLHGGVVGYEPREGGNNFYFILPK